ncbi:MAG TPA: enoyl-CoA hydratase-related protein [Candidatus Polarisedimenticolia bacterium]|nr:enoyl-CoA hydratase-related protein [Candidatus Polarisedimenticolia bacterium]
MARHAKRPAARTRPRSGTGTGVGFDIAVRDRVARLTLRRPPLNILNIETCRALATAVRGLAAHADVGVLVVAAEGRSFSAGVDIGEHLPPKAAQGLRTFHAFCRALLLFPRPTVARVQGDSLGGGLEVVLCCDVAIASSSARLGLPEIGLGVFPPLAASLLPRLAGRRAAAEAILWGEALTAERALRLGFVSEVVPAADLEAAVERRARRVASLSGAAVALARRAILRGAEGPLEPALRAVESIYLRQLLKTRDAREGLEAFLDKRPPTWKHR